MVRSSVCCAAYPPEDDVRQLNVVEPKEKTDETVEEAAVHQDRMNRICIENVVAFIESIQSK